MDFFEWINTLTPSAAQFWGAFVGVGGGLTAILIGAFLNAVLNRRRDDRLRDLEGRAVAAAIRGELSSMKISISDLLPMWEESQRELSAVINRHSSPKSIGAPIDSSKYAKLPPFYATIFEANASKLGLLGSDLAGAVTVIYTNYRVRSEIFKQSIELMAQDLPEHFAQQIKWGKFFRKNCGDIERFLIEFEKTGRSGTLAVEAAEFRRKQQEEHGPS